MTKESEGMIVEAPTEEIPKEVEIKIVLTNEGQIRVYGPIENEPLMLWLFEKAKDIVKGSNLRKNMEESPKITREPHGVLNFVRRGFK